jgi:hypothetical protein
VDQVVGNIDVRERAGESVACERVTAEHLDLGGPVGRAVRKRSRQRRRHPCGVAAECADGMPLGQQPRDKQRAGEAAGAGDEDAHRYR